MKQTSLLLLLLVDVIIIIVIIVTQFLCEETEIQRAMIPRPR